MHVHFVLPDAYGMGGRVRSVFNLAGALSGRHTVHVASLQQGRPTPALPLSDDVELVALGSDAALASYLSSCVEGVLVGTRPDLNIAVARDRRASVAGIGQEHFHLGRYGQPKRTLMQEWYPRLDAHVSLTESDATAFHDLLGPIPPTLWIPNAVDEPGGVRPDLSEPVAIAAGRLARQKGYDRLLRAWRTVADVHPEWRLRIFGEGDKRIELEQLRDSLGLTDVVEMPGFTDHLDQELANASFFVLSSRFEGLPMVMIEAMAVGLPVVAFDCPTGPRDLIGPAEGLLVPNGRVRQLARAMIEMIERGPDRLAMGEAARARSEQFRLPAITHRWDVLFEKVTQGSEPTGIA